ncbi:hypothetical protein HPB52_005015 [Rhipicephalus sanguineus]|uniref:ATP-dependent RNA helicase DHX34 n=1 Tax=Rhipicephalus sanguineus TaxID=34632 RepID=A0A9D4QFF6_RHISA|nr:hypothetical protein HPB52_005015 [Rhipicephalus sanguineus]
MGRDHDRRHHHKSSHKRKRSEDLGDSDSGHSKHGRRRSSSSRNSKQYDNFWTFLKKYEERKQKTAVEAGTSKADPWECAEQSLGLPPTYDPVHKVNFSIFPEEPKVLMLDAGVHIDSSDASHSLTEEDVAEVRTVFHLYLDFLQRQKFQKLKKLREFQKNLPIAQYKDGILKVVSENSVVLIAGDTGCGKSTQIPQYLLGAGLEGIACTQPRRIAAISLCKRVAYETLNEYRTHIGYQIRFEKHRSKHTKMLFLTEGLLLRQIASDPMLKEYNVIILDEIHERHLTCDFLLGVVKCLMQHRKDLKIILMSATINIQLFSQYFYNCPVVQVPGRLFPIQVQYHPVTVEEKRSRTGRLNPAPYVKLLSLIDNKYPSNERGDLLVFLSGMSEISAVQEAAEEYANQNGHWIILPLHSTLSLAEQDKVFDYAPEKTRKCILSTNIAETSVTIDGVRFVVDSGKVKEMSYDSASHMQKLKEFWISRASAEQRKGRAGRTGPGVCFRLYSEAEYEALAAYSTPEIQRVPLNSLLLQLVALGLPDVRKFPFLEPPPSESIEEAVQTLKEQGALTADEDLTPTGRILSQLPVDVTIGKVLILGCVFRLVDPILSLAAALSIQSPFTQRSFRDLDASVTRKSVDSDHGDPFTLLNAYHEWLAAKSSYGEDTRKWCRRLGLEEQRFYEMTKLRSQFKKLLQEVGLMENEVEVTDSVARIQRHGEMKQLRDLRRQLQKAPRKKRILRIGNWGDEDEEEEQVDIKDVEFRLQQDPTLVQSKMCSLIVNKMRVKQCLLYLKQRDTFVDKVDYDDCLPQKQPGKPEEPGGEITAQYLKDLYKMQQHSIVKPVWFLTRKHVHPTSMKKINVRRAVQVVSPPVTAALKLLKEQAGHTCDTSFAHIGSTVVFMDTTYRWFTLMDVSNCTQLVHQNNPDCKQYESKDAEQLGRLETTFLDYLAEIKRQSLVKNFLTKETYEGLLITTISKVECIRYLLTVMHFRFVLTRKMSSDPIEAFSVWLRKYAGSNDQTDIRAVLSSIEKALTTGTSCTFSSINVMTADSSSCSSSMLLHRPAGAAQNDGEAFPAEATTTLKESLDRGKTLLPTSDVAALAIEFLRRSRSFGFHDLSLMKLILCSGVYPQIAISDDHNSYKRDSDQLFHTKGKGFVVLHPNSVLALHAEVLRLDDMDVLTVPNFRSNLPVSSKHQVVAFMSLLETTKPYLLNCLRVQCVQMLLLVSSAIDSSMTMSRLVFDEFVEVTFPDPDEALQLLLKVLAARNLYERLVAHMLEETLSSEDKKEPSPQVRHMQKQLRKRYDAVLKTEIAYTVKRLLPADVKHLYAGAQAFRALAQENEDGLSEDRFKMNPRKGGVFISGYFTFGCLEEISMPEETLVDKTCKCPLCDLELPFAVMDAVLHLDACDKDNLITKGMAGPLSVIDRDAGSCPPTEDEVLAEDDKSDPLKKAYFCKECSRELRLTLPEIFQHRKTHQSTSQGMV